jgi:two-component system cell cycle sensor histidine kinase/response regulator CckA
MFNKGKRGRQTPLSSIIEELKDGFCTVTINGDFIYLNHAAREMIGISSEMELNQYNLYRDIVRDQNHCNKIQHALVKQAYIKDYEIDIFTLSNSSIPILLSINQINDPAKKVVGYAVLLKDMTYIKKVQNQLIQAQKMESMGLLVSGIAHEFNNILSGIIPNAELIKMTSSDLDANYARADSIQKSALRAADIVKQLLSFARDNRKTSDAISDFFQVATETLDILRKLVDRKIDMDVKFPPDLYFVKLDATRLQQIIMNLTINSKDAIEDTGKIIFSASNTKVEGNQSVELQIPMGIYVKFQISDTGRGIAKDKLDKIFDPFFSTKEPGKGTGLGLSIVYGIITNIHGKIIVDSKENIGTTFTLYFPATESKIRREKSEYQLKMIGQGKSVLVVDDENLIREMAKDMLEALGYKVHLAENGLEAIQVYQENKASLDLVILDMIMPEMSGTTCVQKLKKIKPDVKIIVTSGASDLENILSIEKIGISAFLPKPYTLKSMSKILSKIDL